MGCISSKSGDTADGASSKNANKNVTDTGTGGSIQLDTRLPFQQYREAFQLKNYWKSVRRKESASKDMFWKFLKSRPELLQKYPTLKDMTADDERLLQNPEFESLAQSYLQVFDDVVCDVEASPGNVEHSINKLIGVGKMHKGIPGMTAASFQDLEDPFMHMIQEVLQDRYNDKSEALFSRFFRFCLKYIVQGFES